jgi:ADP-dependent glucokinase
MTSFFKYFTLASFVALLSIIFQAYNESGSLTLITSMVQQLLQLEVKFKVINKQIVVGYGSCSDLTVKAIDFLNYTENLKDFENRKDIEDDEIHTEEDFMKSFMYYFSRGAAAERYTPNKKMFLNLVQRAKNLAFHRWELGGNAPVMGTRFFLEGANVLIASQMSKKQLSHLNQNIHVTKFNPSDDFVDDIHLIMEYKTGDVFGETRAPRANRYIVHSDSNNPMISSLELLNVNQFNPDLFVVSGLQMLDNFPFKSNEVRHERLQAVQRQMTSAKAKTLIHFEFASFVEIELFNELLENVVPYADSLGMNEQEVDNLINVLETGKISLSADSNPRVATTLDQMRRVFKILNRNYFEKKTTNKDLRMITRIHVHTLAFQLILNVKKSQWKNIKSATAKSSLTAHRHVCQTSYVNPENSMLILDESFSTSADAHNDDGDVRPSRIDITTNEPVPCWNEILKVDNKNSIEVEICVSPVFVCKEAKKTVGAGDNISAAGLVLQI